MFFAKFSLSTCFLLVQISMFIHFPFFPHRFPMNNPKKILKIHMFPIDFPEILFFSWVSHSFPVVPVMAFAPISGLHVGGGAQLFDLLHGHSQLPLQGLADGLGEGFAMANPWEKIMTKP